MKIWFRTGAGQSNGRRNEHDGEQSPPQDRSVSPTSAYRRSSAPLRFFPALTRTASRISNRNWLANRSHTKQTIKPLLTGARIAHSDCDPLAKWRPAVQALTCLILQQFFALAAAVPVHAQDSVPVLDTTVCELTAHPGQLDGKTVRVKVQFSHGNAVKDADSQCPRHHSSSLQRQGASFFVLSQPQHFNERYPAPDRNRRRPVRATQQISQRQDAPNVGRRALQALQQIRRNYRHADRYGKFPGEREVCFRRPSSEREVIFCPVRDRRQSS